MKSDTLSAAAVDRKALLADTLYSRILTLQLAPGAALNELTLCDEFGLSRSTVRTALQQLGADGLLELRSNRSPIVAAMSPAIVMHFQQSAPLLYTAVARLAALNARPWKIDALHRLHACFAQALHDQDLEAWLGVDNALHREVERLAANEYLSPGLRRLQVDHARLCRTFYGNRPWLRTHQDFTADARTWHGIIEAIAGNDCEHAGQLTRTHLETLCQRLSWHHEPLNKEPASTPVTVLRSGVSRTR